MQILMFRRQEACSNGQCLVLMQTDALQRPGGHFAAGKQLNGSFYQVCLREQRIGKSESRYSKFTIGSAVFLISDQTPATLGYFKLLLLYLSTESVASRCHKL